MRWLSRVCLIVLCFTMLSCSASCMLYLHNDTSSPYEYKISANIDLKIGKGSASGKLGINDADSTLSFDAHPYASPDIPEIDHVDLEITQNGKTRKHRFEKSELPPFMSKQNGYGEGFIKVTETEFLVGDGSGNWGADFQRRYYVLFGPCLMLLFVAVIIGLVHYLSNQKKRFVPRD